MAMFQRKNSEDGDHWITVSDLMSGLMVIFLFIAISYIRPMLNERNTVRDIAVTWQQTEVALVEALYQEFKDDLPKWNAELDHKALVIRFNAPEVLFANARADIRSKFQEVLADFFPRYLKVLNRFRQHLEEVRIEGHTSSDWGSLPGKDAYFKNMDLSQARTRSVLEFGLNLPIVAEHRDWAAALITANGLSSSQLIRTADGREDPERSRRVEFRVRTNAKQEIVRIVGTVMQ